MGLYIDDIKKIGTNLNSEILSKSSLINQKDNIPTSIPILNIALAASTKSGLTSGVTFIAGPSRHFKSLLGLMLVKAYLDRYPDSICLFYDSEFGITKQYIEANQIDPDRVLHLPIVNLEELKFDLAQKLEHIKRGDKVIVFIDSLGNLASKKEADDALKENSAADMTRAKVIKSLGRIITPHLTIKDLPCIVVNHVYMEMGMFPKTIMSGGSGAMLSANQVLFIGKSQEKEGGELVGYNFSIGIEKSRFVKEKSRFTFTVTYDRGIQKYSGLMDIALEAGVVIKPSNGFYQKVNLGTGEPEGKKYRMKETNTEEFWGDILASEEFEKYVANRYQLGYNRLLEDQPLNAEEVPSDETE